MKPVITTHGISIVIITVIFLTIYTAVQQGYRTAANDPQIQLARDIKNNIELQKPYELLLPKDSIDISKSLGIFVIFYDNKENPIFSTGFLNGNMPQVPPGVLDHAKSDNENVISWQPQTNTRQALVIEHVSNSTIGFVAVGRSLQEVEIREFNLLKIVGIGWAISIGLIILHLFLQYLFYKKPKQ